MAQTSYNPTFTWNIISHDVTITPVLHGAGCANMYPMYSDLNIEVVLWWMLKLGTVTASKWNHSYPEIMKAKQCNGPRLHTVEKQNPVHNFMCQSFKGPLLFDLFHRLATNYDLLPFAGYPTSVVMHLKIWECHLGRQSNRSMSQNLGTLVNIKQSPRS